MDKMINEFLGFQRSGGNPYVFAKQLLMQNPEAQRLFEQMRNMSNGMTPREFALQVAKQNGMGEREFLNKVSKFGLK